MHIYLHLEWMTVVNILGFITGGLILFLVFRWLWSFTPMAKRQAEKEDREFAAKVLWWR